MKNSLLIGVLIAGSITAFGQKNKDWMPDLQPEIQYYRFPDQRGVGVFETPVEDSTKFEGVKVRVGGAFALQFQGLDHFNEADSVMVGNVNQNELMPIGNNFNLATANLVLDVQLADGVRMNIETYLSSRHHPEAYVKGGYIQFDKLSFLNNETIDRIMENVTIKIGHMETNYGDGHFRRSDNGNAIQNPFVGNYIMDAFTTEVGGEIYWRKNGFIVMGGLTNGKLNQSVANPGNTGVAVLGKLGYDKQTSEDFRWRLTGSIYNLEKANRNYIYGGDRAGSRYYFVMENTQASAGGNFTSGRYNPGFAQHFTAIMVNPYVKWKGLEFFGMYEMSTGKGSNEHANRTWNQYMAEVIYRFFEKENVYIGGRWNMATGDEWDYAQGPDPVAVNRTITRFNLGGGWFMTKNILAKAEYVMQTYDGFDKTDIRHGGSFSGVMLEAVIGF